MIRAFKRLFDTLDRRFPEKVTVTKERFENLVGRIDELEKKGVSEERIKALESEINKFNVELGFFNTTNRVKVNPFTR